MTKRSVAIQVLTMLPSLLGAPCGCLAGWPEGVNVGGSVEAGSFLCLTGGTIPSSRPELCRASRASAVKPSPSETARSGLDGASTALNWLGLGSGRRLPVSRAGGEHGPGNAGGLGGLRQHRHLDRTAGEDAALPLGCAIGTRAGAADDRAGPQCQQLSEPDIALAANAALAALQAARSTARGQAAPGGEVAGRSKLLAIADGGDDGVRGQTTDAGDGGEPPDRPWPRP